MKSLRQPLSEAFVYGSPERIPGFSFRWVAPVGAKRKTGKSAVKKGARNACKFQN